MGKQETKASQVKGIEFEEIFHHFIAQFIPECGYLLITNKNMKSGLQGGKDFQVVFAHDADQFTWYFEAKNYEAPLNADKILAKLLQIQSQSPDMWILVSPKQDVPNQIQAIFEEQKNKTPFIIGQWTPSEKVQELFSLYPDIFKEIYGSDVPSSLITKRAEIFSHWQQIVKHYCDQITKKRIVPDKVKSERPPENIARIRNDIALRNEHDDFFKQLTKITFNSPYFVFSFYPSEERKIKFEREVLYRAIAPFCQGDKEPEISARGYEAYKQGIDVKASYSKYIFVDRKTAVIRLAFGTWDWPYGKNHLIGIANVVRDLYDMFYVVMRIYNQNNCPPPVICIGTACAMEGILVSPIRPHDEFFMAHTDWRVNDRDVPLPTMEIQDFSEKKEIIIPLIQNVTEELCIASGWDPGWGIIPPE